MKIKEEIIYLYKSLKHVYSESTKNYYFSIIKNNMFQKHLYLCDLKIIKVELRILKYLKNQIVLFNNTSEEISDVFNLVKEIDTDRARFINDNSNEGRNVLNNYSIMNILEKIDVLEKYLDIKTRERR